MVGEMDFPERIIKQCGCICLLHFSNKNLSELDPQTPLVFALSISSKPVVE